MPEISRFYGLVIYLYWDEGNHHVPHFHVRYNNYKASIAISNSLLLAGNLPLKAFGMVAEWATLHQIELMENWELVRNGEKPKRIKGLE